MYHIATYQITNKRTNRVFDKKVCLVNEDKDAALFEAYDVFELLREDHPEWHLQGPSAISLHAA